MISIVVYGRNDDHGCGVGKRAALSLNCMAAVLTDPVDEILFVDFNTRDDFPTLPEAIRDTLTAEARKRVRILRVRPSVHARYAPRTHLGMVEPVARNVAARRSNPANRWILSTNTDMIFTPREGRSLSELARDLPPGYYGTPRFELPEILWQSLDRTQPEAVLAAVAEWGWKFHLNGSAHLTDAKTCDASGDFQLMERDDLFKIHGFHEAMLSGWDVDSNLWKRLSLLRGAEGDLSRGVFGYHCQQLGGVMANQRPMAVEERLMEFVHMVTRPELPEQAGRWGLADEEIEELRLDGAFAGYPAILAKLAGAPFEMPNSICCVDAAAGKPGYDPAPMLPFLADLFANAHRNAPVAWVGGHARLFALFREMRRSMGFTGPIMVCGRDAESLCARGAEEVEVTEIAGMCFRADAFIFDYARPDGRPLPDEGEPGENAMGLHLRRVFWKLIEVESALTAEGAPPRRIIAIDAVHNRFESMVTSHLDTVPTPSHTRLRHGTLKPRPGLNHWLALGTAGPAGVRSGDRIETAPGVAGNVIFGPYLPLEEGRYVATFEIEAEDPRLLAREQLKRGRRTAHLDVASGYGQHRLGFLEINEEELTSGKYLVTFEITEQDENQKGATRVEARAWTSGQFRFALTALDVDRVDENGDGAIPMRGKAGSGKFPVSRLASYDRFGGPGPDIGRARIHAGDSVPGDSLLGDAGLPDLPAKVSYCTTCANRLYQMRQTFAANLKWISEDPDTEWIILNLNSKDDLHQFMIEQMRVAPPRVIYARDLSNHPWHKSVATNAAHRLARGDILVNLDCDNFIGEATQLIRAGFAPDVDVIHLWSGERGDGSCGRVAISRDAFYRLGGYDESFHPMGYQDMDILERARARGMKLLRIPSSEYLPIRNDKLESMRHCAGGISQWEELNQENRTVSRINIASRRFAANAGKNWGRLKLEIVAGGGRESPRFRGEVLSQGKI